MKRPLLILALLLANLGAAGWVLTQPQQIEAALPAGTTVLRDVAYGAAARQKLDVYIPATLKAPAPIMLIVHGGGWSLGNKADAAIVGYKPARWLPQGFIFVSIGYRLLPDVTAVEQSEDVAQALAYVQQHADEWGGNGAQLVLVGHSAGAHLAALVSTSVELRQRFQVKPWLGTISLDGTLNPALVMSQPHRPVYDPPFGTDPSYWNKLSPHAHITADTPPLMLVCGNGPENDPIYCAQALQLRAKAKYLGVISALVPVALGHNEMNNIMGQTNALTHDVEAFMRDIGVKF